MQDITSAVDGSVLAGRAPPERLNAARYLLEANAGHGERLAYIDDTRRLTYTELANEVRRCAAGLLALGLRREERVLMVMHDSVDFVVAFLGALYAGVVPVPVNTLLTVDDYTYMLAHSGARAVVVSAGLLASMQQALGQGSQAPREVRVVVSGGDPTAASPPTSATASPTSFERLTATAALADAADTLGDDIGFWLYSSGSTGRPKGTVHTHANLWWTAALYAVPVLGLRADDTCFSAAKLFFAYGLGNALTFPMSVGATTVLMAERPTPQAVFKRWVDRGVTVFFGAPTGYAGMLAAPDLPPKSAVRLRLCSSAGEALPREIGERFDTHYGCEIIDGIGSTEMLHIFLSNRPGDVNYGSTGRAVPGYRLKLVAESGEEAADGEIGDLYVAGPSAALMYWAQRDKSRATFLGEWTKNRRQVLDRRSRLLCLRRPQRRHAEGERRVRVAVRGRSHADAAPRGARVRGVRQGRCERSHQDQGLRRAQGRGLGDRDRTAGVRERPARALQVPALYRVHRRVAEDRDRQDPALSTARARGRPRRRASGRHGVTGSSGSPLDDRDRRSSQGADDATHVTIDWQGAPARIEYRWLGAGDDATRKAPVVVFLHEGLGSVSAWRDFPARFCVDNGFRGLVFSRRGYGRSTPRPPAERWPVRFMHEQAERVLPQLFARLGIEQPWLFGHSDGASIALLHAATHDVAGVIAVAPHLFVEDLSIAGIEAARAAYDHGDLRRRLERHHDDVDSAFRGWNDIWLDPAFRTWNIEAELAAIRCPVLAVQGEGDEYGTLAQIDALARLVPQTRRLVLADCGHAPHRDQPEALTRAAARLIRGLPHATA